MLKRNGYSFRSPISSRSGTVRSLRFQPMKPTLILKVVFVMAIGFLSMRPMCAQETPGATSLASKIPLSVQNMDKLPSSKYPQLVYWFWTVATITNHQYLQDIDRMATESPFTMTFLTARQGVDFYDYSKMHDLFADAVREAHAKNIKVGLQLWEYVSGRPRTPGIPPIPVVPKDKAVALVSEGEVTLDAKGHADYTVTMTDSRWATPIASEFLRAYAFRKTGDGFYDPASLRELDSGEVKTVSSNGDTVTLSIDAPSLPAGSIVYILAAHYENSPDLFNDEIIHAFDETLRHYADIPFDGTALDEFGWIPVKYRKDGSLFRSRIYGLAFAGEYKKRTGLDLARTLFDMRYAPENHTEVRIKAIDTYFDVLRDGPLRVETAFRSESQKLFGASIFSGIHDTFHNSLNTDDIWRVGLNYWRLPRDYGQSDEDFPPAERMGLLVSHIKPIMYDQFYSKDIDAFPAKALRDACFGGRIHYHAWNDTGKWGVNIADPQVLAQIRPVEEKIRLLNEFDPAAPSLPTLILFGMPAQLNWYPDAKSRSDWDIDGSLGIEQKAAAVWNAGYPCALLPTDLIDNGELTVDSTGHPVINGHRFSSIVFLYPQYSKRSTLSFLERYLTLGGKLMLEGTATRDFLGADITDQFKEISRKATVRDFDPAKLGLIGVQPNQIPNGEMLEDGAVVFTDPLWWKTHAAKPFSVELAGHLFTGSFEGVCALKTDKHGKVEKFVCGGFRQLQRDGETIFSLPQKADVVIRRKGQDDYQTVVVKTHD
jgi:hypothetical protein